jgi:N-methylhydantoinase A/oxoprolinase/acetone carboxylase beta subunit
VVLVNVRVAVIGKLPTLPGEPARQATPAGVSSRRRRVYLERWLDVPVYDLDRLGPGVELKGPVVCESATTTVIVRETERVLVTSHGWLDIRLG